MDPQSLQLRRLRPVTSANRLSTPKHSSARPSSSTPSPRLQRLGGAPVGSEIIRCSGSGRVLCRSSPLATYQLLQDHSPRRAASPGSNWLVEAVPGIIKRLGRTSSLHMVRSTGSAVEVNALPASVDNAEYWRRSSEQASNGTDVNALILVRPISSPEDYCPLKVASASSSPSTPSGSSSSGVPHAAGPASGHCCEGRSAQVLSSISGQSLGSMQDDWRGSCEDDEYGAGPRHQHSGEAYYGVVVQSSPACSSRAADAVGGASCNDGCYVLKVCRSPGGAAGLGRCMHYTLTKVCQGQPLYAQLQGSWLSGSAA